MIDFAMEPIAAIDQPRFHLNRAKSPSEPKNALELEEGFDSTLAEELKKNWKDQFQTKEPVLLRKRERGPHTTGRKTRGLCR